MSPYKKPMSKLLLPSLKNTITNMRSASNPLLKLNNINNSTPENSNDNTPNDEKYDLFLNVMTPSVQTTYSATDESPTPKPVFKEVSSNPMPEKQHLDTPGPKHRHSRSGNDIIKINSLKTFTLMDAIIEMRNDASNSVANTVKSEGITPYNYKKQYDFKAKVKRKRGFSDYNGRKQKHSKHIQNESVASVVNLIVAQGLYDKKRAKKMLKS
eukprot:746394_1